MDRELRTQARLSKRTLTTQADIGNSVYGTEVHSVNGKAGHVVLSAEDVGALPSDTPIPSLDGYATEEWVQEQRYAALADIPPEKFLFVNMTVENESYVLDHTYEEIRQAIDNGMYPIIVDADGKSTLYPLTYKTASGLMFSTTQGSANWTIQLTSSLVNKINTKLATKAEIPTVPTDVSAFTNDAGYLSEAYYIVTVTQNGNTYTADHTYAEVNEAYQAGEIPILKFNESLIPMQYCHQGMATFTKVIAYSYYQFTLISQNNYTILFTTIPLARQSDVYTKTEIDSKIGDIETLLQGI